VIPSESKRREPPPRPRPGEIVKKITEADRLLKIPRWSPADPVKLKANFDELEQKFGNETTLKEDQTAILVGVLREIRPEHYVGQRPPELAYEPAVRNQDMWEFKWNSAFFGNRMMYLKFCFSRGDDQTRRLFVLSIHENRPI
jgi:hypothetical protein